MDRSPVSATPICCLPFDGNRARHPGTELDPEMSRMPIVELQPEFEYLANVSKENPLQRAQCDVNILDEGWGY